MCKESPPGTGDIAGAGGTGKNPDGTDGNCPEGATSLACAHIGPAGNGSDLTNNTKTMSINKEPGFGPENGSCPAPRVLNLHGFTLELPWTYICGLASGMRPLFIGFAYLGAALSFFGIGRKS